MATKPLSIAAKMATAQMRMELELLPTEHEILKRVREGETDSEIEDALGISSAELEAHKLRMVFNVNLVKATREGFAKWTFRR